MSLKRQIRVLVGGVAVLTLLALIAADTIHPTVTFATEDKLLVTSLITGLLGIDIALNQLPISLDTGDSGGKGDE
jgi:hypothetical protein